MLDNKFLEALAAVIEEGGFDKASLKLNLSQPAVSQRIRTLEEQVGQVLVVRSTPPEPTSAGRELIKHLRKVRLLELELEETMQPNARAGFITLPVGVNADSLATWFLEAVEDFVRERGVLLDLYVDDENQTHELLKKGDVVGCIGTGLRTLKGCRSDYLGTIDYICVCRPEFRQEWFSKGFTQAAVAKAPAAVFNRKDETQSQMLAQVFPGARINHPIFYVPSSEGFVEVVLRGLAYGMTPEPQAREHLESGRLVELLGQARVPVPLYWQAWDLDSSLLKDLGRALIRSCKNLSG